MDTTQNIVFQHKNNQVVQEGKKYFTRTTEGDECFESGDFNTLERAIESLGILSTTTENSILIAEFMGGNIDPDAKYWLENLKLPNNETRFHIEQGKYNSDWNWLMEVVEKIKSLGFRYICYLTDEKSYVTFSNYTEEQINSNVFIGSNGKGYETENNPIEAVYNACVEFIKWYNQQKN